MFSISQGTFVHYILYRKTKVKIIFMIYSGSYFYFYPGFPIVQALIIAISITITLSINTLRCAHYKVHHFFHISSFFLIFLTFILRYLAMLSYWLISSTILSFRRYFSSLIYPFIYQIFLNLPNIISSIFLSILPIYLVFYTYIRF